MEDAAQEHHRTAQQITDNLNREGHPTAVKDVMPVNAETPIEVVGGELVYGILETVRDMATGASKVRTTPSGGFLGAFVGRLLKKRGPNEQVVEK